MKILVSRFFGWWLSLGTLYASTGGGCPCCGAPGCPVGFSGAGLVGAAFALLMRGRARLAAKGEGGTQGGTR